MAGLYIGSTTGYSGKNMIVMGLGLRLQKEGFNVGYMKPVGALPMEIDGKLGDEDAAFVQDVLGVTADPEMVTPVVVTQDFKVKAFTGKMSGLLDKIAEGYATVSEDKDVTLVAGSGSMYSGKYCDHGRHLGDPEARHQDDHHRPFPEGIEIRLPDGHEGGPGAT